jgi:hypothetical protein
MGLYQKQGIKLASAGNLLDTYHIQVVLDAGLYRAIFQRLDSGSDFFSTISSPGIAAKVYRKSSVVDGGSQDTLDAMGNLFRRCSPAPPHHSAEFEHYHLDSMRVLNLDPYFDRP